MVLDFAGFGGEILKFYNWAGNREWRHDDYSAKRNLKLTADYGNSTKTFTTSEKKHSNEVPKALIYKSPHAFCLS